MLGKPQYCRNQIVRFQTVRGEELLGEISIIDAYGTFEQDEEPSYDIYRAENNTLYKHIRESSVFPV